MRYIPTSEKIEDGDIVVQDGLPFRVKFIPGKQYEVELHSIDGYPSDTESGKIETFCGTSYLQYLKKATLADETI